MAAVDLHSPPRLSRDLSVLRSRPESDIYSVFDPNLDTDSGILGKHLVLTARQATFAHACWRIEEDSPYPEVRSAVANFDDPDMPASTFRAWVLGLCWAIILPGLNQFFFFRYPTVQIGGVSAIAQFKYAEGDNDCPASSSPS